MSSAHPSDSRRATSAPALTHVALQLFYERGFDQTTIDDIARAAGIGRRTFFRYFASKNDVPWGDFDRLVAQFRARLLAADSAVPLVTALHTAIVEFNTYPESELHDHRRRMRLLLTVPTLVAHSTLRFEAWRDVVAEFVARRSGTHATDLRARVIGWAYMAASIAAYEQWLADPDTSLVEVIDEALTHLESQFGSDAAFGPGTA